MKAGGAVKDVDTGKLNRALSNYYTSSFGIALTGLYRVALSSRSIRESQRFARHSSQGHSRVVYRKYYVQELERIWVRAMDPRETYVSISCIFAFDN